MMGTKKIERKRFTAEYIKLFIFKSFKSNRERNLIASLENRKKM